MGLSGPAGGLAVFLATGFHLSYIPSKLAAMRGKWTGAGLIGTLEGLALLPLLPEGGWKLWWTLAASVGLASWVCGKAEKALAAHDDSRIVLDEIVGFWVAAALLPRTPAALGAAFVLFRLFDTVKLAPYRWLERLPGGVGVVADDVGAGIFANVGVRILMHLGTIS